MRSRLSPRLLLALGAILVTLAGTEIALRILGQPRFLEAHTDPARFAFTDRGTEHAPLYLNMPGRITFRYDGNPRGYFDAKDEVHHDVNPSGFRGPALKAKPAGTLRLVFLGDSFTFGEGVHNHDTFPEVTARVLRKEGRPAESANLGVGGYNTTQSAEVLRLFGFNMKPDAVILGYTLNDAEPPLFQVDPKSGKPVRRAREAAIESEAPPRKPPSSPLYRFHLARAIWQAQRLKHLSKQTVDYYRSMHADSNPGRRESERALRQMIAQCTERGIPCLVVMFPLMYELSDDYPFTDIHESIGQVVEEAGGIFIDLLPHLKGRDARQLIVHPTDQHPNEQVHAIAGRLVAAGIRSRQIPPFPFMR